MKRREKKGCRRGWDERGTREPGGWAGGRREREAFCVERKNGALGRGRRSTITTARRSEQAHRERGHAAGATDSTARLIDSAFCVLFREDTL